MMPVPNSPVPPVFADLSFPTYFLIDLSMAKLAGVAVLLISIVWSDPKLICYRSRTGRRGACFGKQLSHSYSS